MPQQLYVVSERKWTKNHIYDPLPKAVVVASNEEEVLEKMATYIAQGRLSVPIVLDRFRKEVLAGKFIIQPVDVAID